MRLRNRKGNQKMIKWNDKEIRFLDIDWSGLAKTDNEKREFRT
jgi:hypothetical protein